MQEKPKWEDTPGFVRDQLEGGINLGEMLVRDYRDCVTDKEIADRRFDREDPEAWAKTVKVLVANAFLLGHMVAGADSLGYPEARALYEKYAPSRDM